MRPTNVCGWSLQFGDHEFLGHNVPDLAIPKSRQKILVAGPNAARFRNANHPADQCRVRERLYRTGNSLEPTKDYLAQNRLESQKQA